MVAKVALYPDTDTVPTRFDVLDLGTSYGALGAAAAFDDYMYLATTTGYILKVRRSPVPHSKIESAKGHAGSCG
jgi:hypothetical protein